ncbi:DUF4439 domain-containing protein [Corynebacterium callunae]|uniref:DUF4439 domain-containing protein n=1 Tax=Corynebacterium callunae TaxID=1721 RepID=UPI003982AEF4
MHARTISLISISLLAATLSGCTPSPEPDPVLVEMLQDAQLDSHALATTAPEASALRSEHAQEIQAEIDRQCGYTDEGTVPESCTVELTAIGASPATDAASYIADSQSLILDKLDEIPADSVALITEQYIEQARFTAAPEEDLQAPTNLTLTDAEQAVAKEMLSREYAAAWSLGVALAYSPTEQQSAIESAISNHQQRASVLVHILGDSAEDSFSPGYRSDIPEPTDAASAQLTVSKVQENAVSAWHAAAAASTTDAWRVLCTEIAGDTAREL